jgi:hypothetical protein
MKGEVFGWLLEVVARTYYITIFVVLYLYSVTFGAKPRTFMLDGFMGEYPLV